MPNTIENCVQKQILTPLTSKTRLCRFESKKDNFIKNRFPVLGKKKYMHQTKTCAKNIFQFHK